MRSGVSVSNLVEMSKAKFWCQFEVIRDSDGVVLITARQALALVQMPEGRPVRLPAEWISTYGAA